jgi:hypothetical protein
MSESGKNKIGTGFDKWVKNLILKTQKSFNSPLTFFEQLLTGV